MPHISSSYKAYGLFKIADFNTVLSNQYRSKKRLRYNRERIECPDGDFFDVDWSKVGKGRLMVFVHGLAGSAEANYVKSSCIHFNNAGWDAVAMNYRAPGGEPNRRAGGAHSGWTEDLEFFLNKLSPSYEEICIVGQSLGGSIILNYLVKCKSRIPNNLGSASMICPALHHLSGVRRMNHWSRWPYSYRFIRRLRKMLLQKKNLILKEGWDYEKALAAKNLEEFDDAFTAPVHNYTSANEYYVQNSMHSRLSEIDIPVYMICTLDDPFYDSDYYPYESAKTQMNIFLETPEHGGHCGFWGEDEMGRNYAERRILEFAEKKTLL